MTRDSYASATVVSTASNYIMISDTAFTKTYRSYIRPREYGKLILRFWTSNAVDTTWDDGSISRANLQGGHWKIEAAAIADGGIAPDGSVVEGSQRTITFDSAFTKAVTPRETFWSDEVEIELPEDHYLAYTWTISTSAAGNSFPFNTEGLLVSAFEAPGLATAHSSNDAFQRLENCLVLPDFIGYKRPGEIHHLAFFGDSITQGVRNKIDAYDYWVARIAEQLSPNLSVWNLGSGWARAYDAASDGAWLHKAEMNDEIVIVLGVNDIGTAGRSADQVLTDLNSIVTKLRERQPEMKIILSTVPTFNFENEQESHWRQVNEVIRNHQIPGVDRVFDMAQVLSQAGPNDQRMKSEYMTNELDPHPNGVAGTDIAEAFLDWYKN